VPLATVSASVRWWARADQLPVVAPELEFMHKFKLDTTATDVRRAHTTGAGMKRADLRLTTNMEVTHGAF
jgi:hypothetical protein